MPASLEKSESATSCNEVLLVGRLAAPPEVRTLPSGDQVTTWRLVVARRDGDRAPGRPSSDTLDCAAWTGGVRRAAAGWVTGDVLEVRGSLHRRFWKSPGGLASRYEVSVERARRVHRAGAAKGAE